MEFAAFKSNYAYGQPTVLQRLGLEPHLFTSTAVHLQQHLQYFRYSEPLELTTACPFGLEFKKSEVPCKKQKLPVLSPLKKSKATRKLNFDEDNSSPVSGTIIRELRPDENLVIRKGAELAKIENVIGDYVCRLCKELYEDAFGLAQHRCSRIVHVEYRCPECDKVFNCPANLASHRRWHKPRPNKDNKQEEVAEGDLGDQFPCGECGKRFRRIAYLRKHQAIHQIE
ncbi:hypothetical protein NQ314_017990 [Rhamnusium bicolor]|uniref:C2H2-type domain-containing protein n=1 Tax=Rhamnusium bicolor TaxID=1586634 RepID=A0AAV8WRD9_9CUCU|nr:hypothetical protein NQ314_017990 [Rhamnusium bicolor]